MADVGAEEVEDVCTTQDASKVTLPCWDTAEVDPAVDFEGVTAVFGYGSLVRSVSIILPQMHATMSSTCQTRRSMAPLTRCMRDLDACTAIACCWAPPTVSSHFECVAAVFGCGSWVGACVKVSIVRATTCRHDTALQPCRPTRSLSSRHVRTDNAHCPANRQPK
jgi:hypothetical protein